MLKLLNKNLKNLELKCLKRNYSVFSQFNEKILNEYNEQQTSELGSVVSVGDGIARIQGCQKVQAGERKLLKLRVEYSETILYTLLTQILTCKLEYIKFLKVVINSKNNFLECFFDLKAVDEFIMKEFYQNFHKNSEWFEINEFETIENLFKFKKVFATSEIIQLYLKLRGLNNNIIIKYLKDKDLKVSLKLKMQIELELYQLLSKSTNPLILEEAKILDLFSLDKVLEIDFFQKKSLIAKTIQNNFSEIFITELQLEISNNYKQKKPTLENQLEFIFKDKILLFLTKSKAILAIFLNLIVYLPKNGTTRTNFCLNFGKNLADFCGFKNKDLSKKQFNRILLNLSDLIYQTFKTFYKGNELEIKEHLNSERQKVITVSFPFNFIRNNHKEFIFDISDSEMLKSVSKGVRFPMLVKPKKYKLTKSKNDNNNCSGGYLFNGMFISEIRDTKILLNFQISQPLVLQSTYSLNTLHVLDSVVFKAINYLQEQSKTFDFDMYFYLKKNVLVTPEKKKLIEQKSQNIQVSLNKMLVNLKLNLKEEDFIKICTLKKDPHQNILFIKNYTDDLKSKIYEFQSVCKDSIKEKFNLIKAEEEFLLIEQMDFFLAVLAATETDKFYLPSLLDFRIRLHTAISTLCPQKNKWVRGLIRSGKPIKLTPAGFNNLKLAAVRQFTSSRESDLHCLEYFNQYLVFKIKEFRKKPSVYLDADSPGEMLAICFEFEKIIENLKNDTSYVLNFNYYTSLLLSNDATSSALQITSIIARIKDVILLSSLNLFKSDLHKPIGDSYLTILFEFFEFLTKNKDNLDQLFKELYLRMDNFEPKKDSKKTLEQQRLDYIKQKKKTLREKYLTFLKYVDLSRLTKIYNDREQDLSDLKRNSLLDPQKVKEREILVCLRKIFKRSIMTVFYSVTFFRFCEHAVQNYNTLTFSEKYRHTLQEYEEVLAFLLDSRVLRLFLNFIEERTGFSEFKTSIYQTVDLFAEYGQHIQFSNSLSTVHHGYVEFNKHNIITKLRNTFTLKLPTSIIDIDKSKNAICANFIQSLEGVIALVMINKISESKQFDIFTIFDCFVVSPNYTEEIRKLYTETLRETLQEFDLSRPRDIFYFEKAPEDFFEKLDKIWRKPNLKFEHPDFLVEAKHALGF